MASLTILSGGAAQGLVAALAPDFERETGTAVMGTFGAVGEMALKLREGAPADLLILTAAMIAELSREGRVLPGCTADLGTVETGIAIRGGDIAPKVHDADGLRRAFLAADEIYCPDTEKATAGIHVAKVLRQLGIFDEVAPYLKTFPNGATAMRALGASTSGRPIGCTQVTEILITPGITLVGPLPPGCSLATVYTGAVSATAALPDAAERFLALLTGDEGRDARMRAGFA